MILAIRSGMSVKRFHTTPRTQEETVGHHSANVAAIVLRLAPECRKELLVQALMHDVPEYYTGDVPAPFKWRNPDAKLGLKMGELDYVYQHDIPNPLLTEEEEKLLKLADMLDLNLSSIEDWGRGNQYARQLVKNGQEYIRIMTNFEQYKDEVNQMVEETKDKWLVLTIDK